MMQLKHVQTLQRIQQSRTKRHVRLIPQARYCATAKLFTSTLTQLHYSFLFQVFPFNPPKSGRRCVFFFSLHRNRHNRELETTSSQGERGKKKTSALAQQNRPGSNKLASARDLEVLSNCFLLFFH